MTDINDRAVDALVRMIGSDAERNLSLIARFIAAVSNAGRVEIIAKDGGNFSVKSSNDGDFTLTFGKHTERGSYIRVPATLNEIVLGYIFVSKGDGFQQNDEESLRLCKLLAPLAAINLYQLQVKGGAFTDRLTGALINKAFDRAFDKLIEKTKETGGKFSLLLCDLDHFKSVNDTYGHQAGDEILRSVGRIIQTNLPSGAHFGRIGGDEFAILLPGMGGNEALKTGNAVRGAVNDAALLESKRAVTLSMGVSVYGLHGESKIGLREKADIALYVCKERGRNRTVLYESDLGGTETRRTHDMDGIVSEDALRDNERMRFMLSLIELLRGGMPTEEKRRVFINKITEILHAEEGAWLEPSAEGLIMTERASGVPSLYAPVITGGKTVAVLRFTKKPGDTDFSVHDGSYLKYLCGFAAMIGERK